MSESTENMEEVLKTKTVFGNERLQKLILVEVNLGNWKG